MSAEAHARIAELERTIAELHGMLAARASAYDERAAHQAAITDVQCGLGPYSRPTRAKRDPICGVCDCRKVRRTATRERFTAL